MSDSKDEFDCDVKDESWLQDDKDENIVTPNFDESKINRFLLTKTVLIDYIRERTKQIHNKRLLVSSEGEKAIVKVIEYHLKEYLEKFIYVILDLVEVSNLKTIFPRHVYCCEKVVSGIYNSSFTVCGSDETDE